MVNDASDGAPLAASRLTGEQPPYVPTAEPPGSAQPLSGPHQYSGWLAHWTADRLAEPSQSPITQRLDAAHPRRPPQSHSPQRHPRQWMTPGRYRELPPGETTSPSATVLYFRLYILVSIMFLFTRRRFLHYLGDTHYSAHQEATCRFRTRATRFTSVGMAGR